MPNRKTHTAVGTTAGIAATAHATDWTDKPKAIIETIGGGFGGYWGGRAPDLIDPPSSPNHRGLGHGGLAIAALSALPVSKWKDNLRGWAAHCRQRAAESQSEGERLLWIICAALLQFLAGALEGFRAGYASHLAMDFPTAKSLPVLA